MTWVEHGVNEQNGPHFSMTVSMQPTSDIPWIVTDHELARLFLVDLLIVLAPVSAFDQYLAEDKTVNRLQDSFDLWVELCKTTALSHVSDPFDR